MKVEKINQNDIRLNPKCCYNGRSAGKVLKEISYIDVSHGRPSTIIPCRGSKTVSL